MNTYNCKFLVISSIIILFLSCPFSAYSFQKLPTFSSRHPYIEVIANQFDKEKAFEIVAELTKEDYGGRLTGSVGGKKAGKWIAQQFSNNGLVPYQEGSYFQTVTNSMSLDKGDNVIGVIPSKYSDSQQSVIIGAHYDHLGTNLNGQYYPGANDNASGTSVVMEIARVLSQSILLSRIHIVLIAFTGEEQGLYGSKYYVNDPLFPVSEIQGMINLDMVGTGTGVWEIGTNFTSKEPHRSVYKKAIRYYGLKSKEAGWFTRPVTDHYPFYQKGVPVLCLLKENPTNLGGYHNFQDTLDSIDPKNLEECGKFCLYNVLSLVKEYLVIPILQPHSTFSFNSMQWESIYKEREINKLFSHINV